MIPSTRQGCARTLHALSILPTNITHQLHTFSSSPPAESSRQALLRAAQVQRQIRSLTANNIKGKAPAVVWAGQRRKIGLTSYSTAAALRRDLEEDVDEDETQDSTSQGLEKMERRQLDEVRKRQSRPRSAVPSSLQSHSPSSSNNPQRPSSLHDLVDHIHKSHLLRPPPSHRNPLLPFPSPAIPNATAWRQRFLELVLSEPLVAFLSIATLNEGGLACLAAEDFDSLFRQLDTLHRAVPTYPATVGRGDAGLILIRLRDHLYGLAPVDKSKPKYNPGRRLRGRRLEQFLRLCVWFRCDDLARQTFIDYFPKQIDKHHSRIHDLENYARFLGDGRHWTTLINSFAHHNFPVDDINLPIKHWTPIILSKVCTAYLCMGEPSSVVRLIAQYLKGSGKVTSGLYHYLIQAYLEMGNLEQAKKVKLDAASKGFIGKSHRVGEQIAVLRGQRALGFDKELEKRVLEDIEQNKPKPSAEFLHSLVRLRLDNDDLEGAKKLMRWFDIRIWDEKPDADADASAEAVAGNGSPAKISHTDATITLAFDIIARNPDMTQLAAWWRYIKSRKILLHPKVLMTLVNALSNLGHIDEAYEMVRLHIVTRYGSISGSPDLTDTSDSQWTLPPGTSITLQTFNALLAGMADKHGISGIKRTADLMREAEEYADGTTLKIILNAVRQHMTARPTDLANLLQIMLARAKDVNAQIGHIDTMMAEAVKYAAMGKIQDLATETGTTKEDLSDPTVGLNPVGSFATAIEDVLVSLRSRGIVAQSSSLASRLRFEATHGEQQPGIPTAKVIWNELIARGYKPNQRHLLALMQGYADAGQMSQAADVLNLARRTGNRTTKGMLMVLLVGYADEGNLFLAEKVFNTIKRMGKVDSRDAVDVPAVCALIQGYYRKRDYVSASNLTKKELVRMSGSGQLDDKAIITGMTALRWTGEIGLALDLLEKRSEPALNFILRKSVRRIKTHLTRRVEQHRASDGDKIALERVNKVLEGDMEARPYLDRTSNHPFPEEDRIPDDEHPGDIRVKFSDRQKEDLAILFDPNPLPPLSQVSKVQELQESPSSSFNLASVEKSQEELKDAREMRRLEHRKSKADKAPQVAIEQEAKDRAAKQKRDLIIHSGMKRAEAEARVTGEWSKETNVLSSPIPGMPFETQKTEKVKTEYNGQDAVEEEVDFVTESEVDSLWEDIEESKKTA